MLSGVLNLKKGGGVSTLLTSKGRNYTLSFSVKPASSTPGTLFSGTSSSLLAGNGSMNNVMLITGGQPYILNCTLPLNTWKDISLMGIGNGTYLTVTPEGSDEEEVHEFTTTLGVLSNGFAGETPWQLKHPSRQ